MTLQPTLYHKLIDPVKEVIESNDAILSGAFGGLTGDQAEGIRTIRANAWGLYTLLMDVFTSLDIHQMSLRPYLRTKFDQYTKAMTGRSQELLQGIDGELPEEQNVLIAYIVHTSELLERYIRQLWLYSELQTQAPSPSLRAVSLVQFIEQVFDREVTHVDSTSPTVWADPEYLYQIIDELLDNAEKWGTQSPPIRINTIPDGETQLLIVDLMPILPAHQPRLFEPFWQGDPSEDGLGLGLTLAQLLAQLLGGILSYTERGFLLSLPSEESSK